MQNVRLMWSVAIWLLHSTVIVPLLHLTIAKGQLLTCLKYEVPAQTGEEQSILGLQVTDIPTFYKSLHHPAMESLLPY